MIVSPIHIGMRVVFTPLAMLLALAACDEATPPQTTLPSIPPAAAEPAEPPAGSGGTPPAAPLPRGGSGSTPLPTVTDNIVFEIVTDSSPSRSGSSIALPAIEGTRQESTIGGAVVTAQFPDGFTYSWNSIYERHVLTRRQPAPAITESWMASGGTIVVSYSLNAGATWLSGLGAASQTSSYPVASWGRDQSDGYVQLDLMRGNLGSLSVYGGDRRHLGTHHAGTNLHACTTTETPVHPDLDSHMPTLKITEDEATATAEATIAAGAITAVSNIQHRSGTFAGTNIEYAWGDFWGEPQRRSGAAFTFTVTAGQVSAVAVNSGGTEYRKPCAGGVTGPGVAYTWPDGYVDDTWPGYWLTAVMKSDLQYFGSNRILVRFAIITR